MRFAGFKCLKSGHYEIVVKDSKVVNIPQSPLKDKKNRDWFKGKIKKREDQGI